MKALDPRWKDIADKCRVRAHHVAHLWWALSETPAFDMDAYCAFTGLEPRHVTAIVSGLRDAGIDPHKAKRATRLASGFDMPDDWAAWSRENLHWGNADIMQEWEKFRDFWCAKAGKDGAKLDWFATWRNWCRNARVTPSQTPSANGGPAIDPTRAKENAADWAARLERIGRPDEAMKIRRNFGLPIGQIARDLVGAAMA